MEAISILCILLVHIILFINAQQPSAFDHISYNEDFNGLNMNIGWLKLLSCNEGNTNSWAGNDINQFTFPSNFDDIINNSLPYAITIKFLDSSLTPNNDSSAGDYMVKADICSYPVFALNNNLELSFTIDLNTKLKSGASNIDNWTGSPTAISRMESDFNCPSIVNNSSPYPIYNLSQSDQLIVFMGWCGQSLHVDLNRGTGAPSRCAWQIKQQYGVNIDVYIGFEIDGNKCHLETNGNYSLTTPAPTRIQTGPSLNSVSCQQYESTRSDLSEGSIASINCSDEYPTLVSCGLKVANSNIGRSRGITIMNSTKCTVSNGNSVGNPTFAYAQCCKFETINLICDDYRGNENNKGPGSLNKGSCSNNPLLPDANYLFNCNWRNDIDVSVGNIGSYPFESMPEFNSEISYPVIYSGSGLVCTSGVAPTVNPTQWPITESELSVTQVSY